MRNTAWRLGMVVVLSIWLGGSAPAQEMEPRGEEGLTNTLYGLAAGDSLTSGVNNTFIGVQAGSYTTTGTANAFVGFGAGDDNETGEFNVFLGAFAGDSNTTGNYNTFVGASAGRLSGSAGSNTFVGYEAGRENSVGQYNTYLGRGAGFSNTRGSYNVFLGYMAGSDERSSNRLHICSDSQGYPLIYGEFDNQIVTINGELESTESRITSDARMKKEIRPLGPCLDKVQDLEGVSYLWRKEEYPGRGFHGSRQIGLLAQDVEEVLPELVSTDRRGFKSVSYDKLTAVLVEAVKELRQENARLKEALFQKLREQQVRIDQLLSRLGEEKG